VRSETGGIYLHDVSKDGRVLLNEYFWYSGLLGFFPGANTERELSWMDQPYLDGITADGTRVVFDEWGDAAGRNGAIYVRATDGSAAVRLGEGEGLAVSPDGRWVLSMPSRSSDDFVLLPTGLGQPRSLSHRGITLTPGTYSPFFPDGRRILYLGSKGNAPPRFWIQDLEGGEPRPVSPEGMRIGPAAISPDGTSFAAARSGSTIAVYPVGGGEPRPLAGAEVDDVPVVWSADGRFLCVRRENLAPA
jgi:Tol biopolymer transport system component